MLWRVSPGPTPGRAGAPAPCEGRARSPHGQPLGAAGRHRSTPAAFRARFGAWRGPFPLAPRGRASTQGRATAAVVEDWGPLSSNLHTKADVPGAGHVSHARPVELAATMPPPAPSESAELGPG